MSAKEKNITLEGAVKLRIKNSPDYFNRLSKEAYSLFDSPSAAEMTVKIFTSQIKEGEPFIPPDFLEKFQELVKKFGYTGGAFGQFIPGRINFNIEDKLPVVNDIVAELVIHDGIVVKIQDARFPEP
jgi:hypothetical protein